MSATSRLEPQMNRSLIQKRSAKSATNVVKFAQCGFMPACASSSNNGTRSSRKALFAVQLLANRAYQRPFLFAAEYTRRSVSTKFQMVEPWVATMAAQDIQSEATSVRNQNRNWLTRSPDRPTRPNATAVKVLVRWRDAMTS